MVLFLVSAIVLVLLDQYTKYIALTQLKPIYNVTFIEGFMDFTFVENRGAAFGMLNGARWFFIIVTAIITVGIIYYVAKKIPKTGNEYKALKFSLMLILAGAWGNVYDRIFRGYVVDFFEFTFFKYPVFNVADIYVVCGAILMSVVVMFFIKEDEKKE
ncbi:MAG: signal peptidase II [Firmicutes bacterium]|nr:signal peptidase II [Bacillota bacterium]